MTVRAGCRRYADDGRRVERGDYMTQEKLEMKKLDGKEMSKMLKKLSEDKKQLLLGIVTGMTLCEEAEKKKTA